jgi:hypothetical protein
MPATQAQTGTCVVEKAADQIDFLRCRDTPLGVGANSPRPKPWYSSILSFSLGFRDDKISVVTAPSIIPPLLQLLLPKLFKRKL